MSLENIKEFLAYDPATGVFTWLQKPRRGWIKAGDHAGWVNPTHGYRMIQFKGRMYSAARLAWFFITGQFPPDDIDHINRNRLDDRFTNLRPATRSQNACNGATRKGRSQYRGVYFNKAVGRWQAQITVNRKTKYLGLFDIEADAARTYDKAARVLHGKFASLNFPEDE